MGGVLHAALGVSPPSWFDGRFGLQPKLLTMRASLLSRVKVRVTEDKAQVRLVWLLVAA
jgi:hypothetical protein